MNSGKNKNTANRTRPTRQEKRAAKREAKMRRKEALRNAPLSVRIRNGALNVITVCLIGIILVNSVGGNIVGKMTVLAEGDAAKRDDITYLNVLPVFNADGTIKE
jgi:hypothetical protein